MVFLRRALIALLIFGLAGDAVASAGYDSIAIVKPKNEETIFSNLGDLQVVVSLSPPLRSGEGNRIVLLVDGQAAGEAAGSRFQLTGIARGTHVLEARVIDRDGTTLVSSAPITIYMWHASRLFRKR